jgi:hypothetical protein
MSGMRAAAGAVRVGIMGLALCVRPGDDGIIVTVSEEVDVCTQDLLQIMRERSARLMLDVPACRSWTAPACGCSSRPGGGPSCTAGSCG